jgi:NADH dehydrogenase FAD-containing subunit
MIPRERAVEALRSERFDVVVIGGGITGAGVAVELERFAEEAAAEGIGIR